MPFLQTREICGKGVSRGARARGASQPGRIRGHGLRAWMRGRRFAGRFAPSGVVSFCRMAERLLLILRLTKGQAERMRCRRGRVRVRCRRLRAETRGVRLAGESHLCSAVVSLQRPRAGSFRRVMGWCRMGRVRCQREGKPQPQTGGVSLVAGSSLCAGSFRTTKGRWRLAGILRVMMTGGFWRVVRKAGMRAEWCRGRMLIRRLRWRMLRSMRSGFRCKYASRCWRARRRRRMAGRRVPGRRFPLARGRQYVLRGRFPPGVVSPWRMARVFRAMAEVRGRRWRLCGWRGRIFRQRAGRRSAWPRQAGLCRAEKVSPGAVGMRRRWGRRRGRRCGRMGRSARRGGGGGCIWRIWGGR